MKKNIIRPALITAFILLIPFVGIQISDEWNWTLSDFVFMGALIFGTGLAYELISKRAGSGTYKAAVGVAVVTSFLLIWVNLAVGIIGSEDNPANALYIGVLFVGIIGAVISRLEPRGMSRTLSAAAFAQMLVPTTAFFIWRPDFAPGVVQVFTLNAFFAMLWVVSALLFQQASDTASRLNPKS